MIVAVLTLWLTSAGASAPLVAVASTGKHAAPVLVAAAPDDDDDDTDAPRPREGALDSLSARERYFPLWFPADLHPQLESFKWTYMLGIFMPTSQVWAPYFMVSPQPDVDVTEFLKTGLVRLGIQIAGHVLVYAGYLVLGLICPPFAGFSLWSVPMYVAQAAWLAFGLFQLQLAFLTTWDAMLKDQHVPERPKKSKHRADD